MTFSDLALIIAVLIAPILAVQVQKWIERILEAKNRRLWVFKTLMSTRATTLSPLHVEALNMIDIEFCGNSRKDKSVIEAWKLYLDHLVNYPKEQDTRIPEWANKREELLIDLLYEMSEAVGYTFDKVLIKRGWYVPKGHDDIEFDNITIRKGLVNVLTGERSIPMEVTSFPVSEKEIKEQQRLRNALLEYVDGKRPLTVKILDEEKD